MAVGEEVSLEFNFAEFRATLHVRARVVRIDGTERIGMEFIDLAPEDRNAIQLYVMGRLNKVHLSQDRAGSRSIWMGQGFLAQP